MIEHTLNFSVDEAKAFAARGDIESWVHKFLLGPGNNKELSDGLKLERRWWRGPLEFPLDDLERTCGPGLKFHEDRDHWNSRIDAIVHAIAGGTKMPPLIGEYKNGIVRLTDGNHRCAALMKACVEKYWAVIWYNSAEDFSSHENVM